jgi:hypothetical protein
MFPRIAVGMRAIDNTASRAYSEDTACVTARLAYNVGGSVSWVRG